MVVKFKEEWLDKWHAEIQKRIKNGQKVKSKGTIYNIDIFGIPKEFLINITRDFNSLLWGQENRAMNQEIQPDEIDILRKLNIGRDDDVLDVGCGSGRLLKKLLELSSNITATDCDEEIIRYLKSQNEIRKISILKDNLLKSKIPSETYDYVLAFENMLGNFIDYKDRCIAMKNLLNPLKNGGILALAYRTDEDRDLVQIDLLPTDPKLFGIWHAFSHRSILKIVETCCRECGAIIEELIHTKHTRPIGGTVSYFIIRR